MHTLGIPLTTKNVLNKMMVTWRPVLLFVFLVKVLNASNIIMDSPTNAQYLQDRLKILRDEEQLCIGSKITLTEKEQMVNKILLSEKTKELELGYRQSLDFLAAQHFFQAKLLIDQSKVFKIIRSIPKGASLHTHLLAATSVDFLVDDVSYREGLYGRYVNGVFKLKFLNNVSDDWVEIKELRREKQEENFNKWLREQLILNVEKPRERYPSVESIWTKFKHVFTTIYDMLSYRPVFEDYIYQVLKELYNDNIMYGEVKGTIMQLYDLNGTTFSKEDFFNIFIETIEKFKKEFPKFQEIKYIHSVYRGVDHESLKIALAEIIEMKKKFPDFIAGFDFVGFEEEGNTLFTYREELLEAQKHLKFFFHAGETNWHGHTDLNILDAILLNSSRIGHGYGIVKHPEVLRIAKNRRVPIEVCPISNQVLMLIDDQRNHPASHLIAIGYPLVICNDDPLLWNATGVSYDWYIAFMAMTSKQTGLEFLKQLAINGIKYSSMDASEMESALIQWELSWNHFLDDMLKNSTISL